MQGRLLNAKTTLRYIEIVHVDFLAIPFNY
jgi:hypothetical protein